MALSSRSGARLDPTNREFRIYTSIYEPIDDSLNEITERLRKSHFVSQCWTEKSNYKGSRYSIGAYSAMVHSNKGVIKNGIPSHQKQGL